MQKSALIWLAYPVSWGNINSIGYLWGCWLLSKVKMMYISSMAMGICEFLENIQSTHTFYLKIFFFVKFYYILKCIKKKKMSNVKIWHCNRTYDVIFECAKDKINYSWIFLFKMTSVLTIRETGLTACFCVILQILICFIPVLTQLFGYSLLITHHRFLGKKLV